MIGKIDGDFQFDNRKATLIWSLPVIDQSNSEGSLEFTVKGKSADFFPIRVDFVAETPFCDIKVNRIESFSLISFRLFSFRYWTSNRSMDENRFNIRAKRVWSSKNTNTFNFEFFSSNSRKKNIFFSFRFLVVVRKIRENIIAANQSNLTRPI